MFKKPSWFRPLDLITFVGTGIAIAGLAIYAMIAGIEGPHAVQGLVLTFVVAGLFLVFWVINAVTRKKRLDTFRWYPTYGFMVHAEDGWNLPSDKVFDELVKRTLESWTVYVAGAHAAISSDVKWVTFRKNFDETALNPAHKKVNGLTIAGSHTFGVDIDSVDHPIEKTAFAHELGHVIMGNATGNWDEVKHHQFMKEHNLQ